MPSYTLRVAVKPLGKAPISGLDAAEPISAGPITISVEQQGQYLVLKARGFDTEDAAERYLLQIKCGLWNCALEQNIAFQADFSRQDITRAEDPLESARNFAQNFGQPHTEPPTPLHGVASEGGYTIYPSDENFRFLSFSGTAQVSTGWGTFERHFSDGISQARPPSQEVDSSVYTSMDLYLASFYETSIRARLLTVITCLEVLAPVTQKHAVVIQALQSFKADVARQLTEIVEPEERDALQALLREIEFKKETSIRRRVRALVLQQAPLPQAEREALAKQVVAAYDLRGTLVHAGTVDTAKLSSAYDVALRAVKLVLQARLGLASAPA